MKAEDRIYTSGEIPSGPLAAHVIKEWHNNTKNTIFPSDSLYAKDWSNALSYLGKKRQKNVSPDPRFTMESPRVYLPLQHPLEGRNNPQPSQVSAMSRLVKNRIFFFFKSFIITQRFLV